MTAGDQRWVLAVDARTAGRLAVAADASGAGPAATPLEQALREAARRRVAPLAVVVVHPATADGDAAARAADDVGAAVGRAVGADAAEWPWPVPLDALEAAAWRALEFGLLPSRGRVVVVDRSTGEAGIVDREHERLTATGRARATAGAQPEPLLALARALLDEAPAGPPFAGVVVTGAPPAGNDGSAAFAAAVARVTGRPPLVPGDPGTAALLGAASLAWSVVSSTRPAPPPGRPAPRADHDAGDDGHAGAGVGTGVGAGVGAGIGAGIGAGQTALPGGPPRFPGRSRRGGRPRRGRCRDRCRGRPRGRPRGWADGTAGRAAPSAAAAMGPLGAAAGRPRRPRRGGRAAREPRPLATLAVRPHLPER